MGESGLAIMKNCEEEKALMLSSQEMSSSCNEARKDAVAAGHVFHDKLGTSTSPDVDCVSGGDLSEDLSSKLSLHDMYHKPIQENGNSKSSKIRIPPATVGTVSSFLGKDYVRAKPSGRRFPEATKPLKLDAELVPMSEIWVEKDKVESKTNQMHEEMEDFLFKMLGEGFQLDRAVIGDVLGKCGYDMQKSMEKLFNYSAEKRTNNRQETTPKYNSAGKFQLQKRNQHSGSQDRNNLQKEVLAALFSSEKHEDLPSSKAVKESAVCSLVVEPAEELIEPPEKLSPGNENKIENPKQDNDCDDEEGSYQSLRKAVQEHRNTMKEYYTAAIEAFEDGDKVRASKLLEKGSFFQRKAREADDESAAKIFETSKNVDMEDSMTLDLHEYDPREATRLLKHHLSSLAGTPAFKYLKVIIETADGDDSKGSRRRRIVKLLEKDSLEWIEEGTTGAILIPLEDIDRCSLSFVKK